MAYVKKVKRDNAQYDIKAVALDAQLDATLLHKSNLVNGFTQTTPGVNALDAAAGKSLNDSLANLSTDVSTNYATKTDLSNRVSVFSPSPGAVTTVTIKADENIMLIAGRRGTNAFLAVLDIWNSNPIYLYTAGAHPTIINNSGTVTITNDANVGSYPFIVIR